MTPKRLLSIALILIMVILSSGITLAQDDGTTTQYFPETGHNVRGAFLTFFRTHGGLEIFGYPLTEAFYENGRLVQYFQRARMEWHPENPEPYKVQLGLLGDLLGYREPPIPATEIPPANHPYRRYYPETGHTLSYAFLHYYDTHGGLDIFGYPITEFVIENGRIVQYFQRGKMEWHPELPSGQRVQLGNLGEIYVERFVDEIYTQPAPPGAMGPIPGNEGTIPAQNVPSTEPPILAIYAEAQVQYAIIAQGAQQTVHVYVTDQRGEAVPGAQLAAIVRYYNTIHTLSLPATDDQGHSAATFTVEPTLPGYIVVLEISARYEDLSTTTRTSFLPWW